jgi:hypothetical protein
MISGLRNRVARKDPNKMQKRHYPFEFFANFSSLLEIKKLSTE